MTNKRKEKELKGLHTPYLERKFEVKVKYQGLISHPVFYDAKIEHKTTPAPFEVVHIDLDRDSPVLDLTYGKIVFYNTYYGFIYTTFFKLSIFLCITNIKLHSFIVPFTYTIPITIQKSPIRRP